MKYLIIFSLFLLVPSLSAREINQNNDFQVWICDHLHFELNECSRFYFNSELRWGEGASKLYLTYVQLRYGVDLCRWLEVAPGYRQQYVLRPLDDSWIPVYDPLTDVFLKFKLRKWKLIDRNRIEYLIFESNPNLWVYRNRFKVIAPCKLFRDRVIPWAFNEWFFRERAGFFQNRTAVGGTFPLVDGIRGDLYYMLRFLELLNEEWRHQHILGVILHFSF